MASGRPLWSTDVAVTWTDRVASRFRALFSVCVAAAVLCGLWAEVASAAYPGRNGRIGYISADGAVWDVAADGSDARQIVAPTPDGVAKGLAYSPDGRGLALVMDRQGMFVATVASGGGNPRR